MTNEFLERIRKYAFACAYHKGMRRPDAQDAVQEAILRVWRRDGSYNPNNPQGLTEWAWYTYIARHQITQYWARKVLGNPLVPDGGAEAEQLTTPDLTSEAGMAAHDSRTVIAALEQLDDTEKYVVTRLYLDDAHYSDVAEELGWSREGARVRQVRQSAFAKLGEDSTLAALA